MRTFAKDEIASAVGTQLEPSQWVTLDQERINSFADCTEDHQFIHIDEEKAAHTPFGGTIAHGFLTLSMLVKLTEENMVFPENMVMGINYGFDKVRFLAPVRAGKRIRLKGEVLDIDQKGDNRFLTKLGVSVEIEGEETPALAAEWLMLAISA